MIADELISLLEKRKEWKKTNNYLAFSLHLVFKSLLRVSQA